MGERPKIADLAKAPEVSVAAGDRILKDRILRPAEIHTRENI
ncbi:MAG: hypothetical protein ACLQE9_00955 [Roseiarcus sp.]